MSYTPTEEEKTQEALKLLATPVKRDVEKQEIRQRKPKHKYPSNYTRPKKKRKK